MRSIASVRLLVTAAVVIGVFTAVSVFVGSPPSHPIYSTVSAASGACPGDDSGLKLPRGFCATIFADGIGHARHLVVAPNNVVYVNTWSGSYYPAGEAVHEGGFLVALQDKSGTGKADVSERFGETAQDGSHGGTGIALYKGSLYAEVNDRIIRYKLPANGLVPSDPPVTVVSGLPLGGDHPMHPFYINDDGLLYVDVATATNACQLKNRTLHSPGADPCKELEARGGIWRYDAKKANQTFSPSERFATGIRNAEGFGVDKANNRVYIAQHGRDQLHANWPEIYKLEEEATLPSEEVMLLKKGGDYGWPECYYDPGLKRLVLAPEYGGDGNRLGVCSTKTGPAVAFPAHWGPNGMVFYDQKQFPPPTATAFSSPSTVPGTALPIAKADITLSSRLSPATGRLDVARFSPTALPVVHFSGRRHPPPIRSRCRIRRRAVRRRRHERPHLSHHLCRWSCCAIGAA